mmetsp:Transcript_8713/g.13017  ORF Transcript_8713/g.13017 Transcript_8713/m.13017 type:complete len:209 (+) Transcript_8713:31-657(+)
MNIFSVCYPSSFYFSFLFSGCSIWFLVYQELQQPQQNYPWLRYPRSSHPLHLQKTLRPHPNQRRPFDSFSTDWPFHLWPCASLPIFLLEPFLHFCWSFHQPLQFQVIRQRILQDQNPSNLRSSPQPQSTSLAIPAPYSPQRRSHPWHSHPTLSVPIQSIQFPHATSWHSPAPCVPEPHQSPTMSRAERPNLVLAYYHPHLSPLRDVFV